MPRRIRPLAAVGGQRLVLGLTLGELLGHDGGEHRIDPLHDRFERAEVRRQLLRAVVAAETIACTEEEPDVGPPEPVDRLLGVTDEEQPAVVNR